MSRTSPTLTLISMYFIIYVHITKKVNSGDFDKKKNIEELFYDYTDEKNSMLAMAGRGDQIDLYGDFYNELDSLIVRENSMNMLFYGPVSSFLRLDTETILHILINTKSHLIPISKVILAWDIVTDGKTAAFLQGRMYLAFGNLLNVVPEEDLYYVNFGDISVLNYFARTPLNLNTRKYGILAASYRRHYNHLWYTNATFINNMGLLICGFPPSQLRKISPAVFVEISLNTLNKLDICSVEQLQTLYDLATHREAYGRPYRWGSSEVTRLGTLFTLIPANDISSIRVEAITTLSARVMRKIGQNKLTYFTMQQIMRMVPKTRRLYILRVQLKTSLDMDLIAAGSCWLCQANFGVIVINLVTLVTFCGIVFKF